MTLSRHAQVENLTNLLGAQRAQTRRDYAHMLLASTILELSIEDVAKRLERTLPADRILPFRAAATRVA